MNNITTDNLKKWPHKVETGHSVEPVFALEANGETITYYRLRDAFNTFSKRGLKILEVYEEFSNRMSNKQLVAFIDAMKGVLNQDKIVLTDVAELITMMERRVKWPVPASELIQKMATAALFDETESPYEYDIAYNNEVKLRLWREHKVSDFFLSMSINDLIPFPNISQETLEGSLRVISEMDKEQMKALELISQKNLKNQPSEAL